MRVLAPLRVLGRWLRLAAALLFVTGALGLASAGPAQAHAILLETDPVEGSVLEEAPEAIELRFSEGVRAVADGIAVFDAQGEPVASSAASRDDLLTVLLEQDVADGTLVVVWRVISADGHPIGGALTFSVGEASATVAEPPVEVVSEGAPSPPALLAPLRIAGYVSLLLCGGLVAFVVLFVPRGSEAARARERVVRWAGVSGVVAAAAWLLALPVVATYLAGGGLSSGWSASGLRALPAAEWVQTAAVAAGMLGAVALLRRADDDARLLRLAAVLAALAVVAPSLTGHSRAATPVALVVGADALHLIAGALWLGGLVGLALTLRVLTGSGGDGEPSGDAAARTLARFSTVAAGVLVALIATGGLMSWRILGSWEALTGTLYGRLLLVKAGLVVVAVGLAAYNRWVLLPRVVRGGEARGAGGRAERVTGARMVARVVGVEAAVLVAVLGATGVLVDRSPEPEVAQEVLDPIYVGPHLGYLDDLEVQAGVSPHLVGPNTLTLQVRDFAGVPTETYEMPRVQLSLDELDLGDVELTEIETGTYQAEVVLPRAGIWSMRVSLRTSEFDNPVTMLEFGVS